MAFLDYSGLSHFYDKLKETLFSGSYNDLTNKPTIPTVTDTYSETSSDAMSGKAVASAIQQAFSDIENGDTGRY